MLAHYLHITQHPGCSAGKDSTQGHNVQLPTALHEMLHAAARHGLVMCVHNGRRVPAPPQAAAGEAPAATAAWESSRADAAPMGPAASGSSAAAHSEASEAAGALRLGGAEAAEAGSSLAAAGSSGGQHEEELYQFVSFEIWTRQPPILCKYCRICLSCSTTCCPCWW